MAAWVIECAGPKYWDGRSCLADSFDREHLSAVRFSREIDASVVRDHLFPEGLRPLVVVREHVWLEGIGVTK